MDITIVNDQYGVCSAEGVCQRGWPVSNIVQGPTFEVWAEVDPIAKKPGRQQQGPADADSSCSQSRTGQCVDAHVLLQFDRISAQGAELVVFPDEGSYPTLKNAVTSAYSSPGKVISASTK